MLRSEVNKKRAMQDSNPRLRLRRPEGYPDYPNRPISPSWLSFLKELARYPASKERTTGTENDEEKYDRDEIKCNGNVS